MCSCGQTDAELLCCHSLEMLGTLDWLVVATAPLPFICFISLEVKVCITPV